VDIFQTRQKWKRNGTSKEEEPHALAPIRNGGGKKFVRLLISWEGFKYLRFLFWKKYLLRF
jgi:hypothetical protein